MATDLGYYLIEKRKKKYIYFVAKYVVLIHNEFEFVILKMEEWKVWMCRPQKPQQNPK